jgi:hypothetical protein
LGFHLFITIRPKKDTECNRKSFGLVWNSVFRFCCCIPAFDLSPVLQGHVITEFFMIPPDFVGQPQRGEMFIDVLIESCLSPSGAAYPRSDVAPDGACQLFLAGTIYIPRRWRFPDAISTKSGRVRIF